MSPFFFVVLARELSLAALLSLETPFTFSVVFFFHGFSTLDDFHGFSLFDEFSLSAEGLCQGLSEAEVFHGFSLFELSLSPEGLCQGLSDADIFPPVLLDKPFFGSSFFNLEDDEAASVVAGEPPNFKRFAAPCAASLAALRILKWHQ